MKDQFSREINNLRISLTDRCNLRCTYCMPAEGCQCLPRAALMGTEEVVASKPEKHLGNTASLRAMSQIGG